MEKTIVEILKGAKIETKTLVKLSETAHQICEFFNDSFDKTYLVLTEKTLACVNGKTSISKVVQKNNINSVYNRDLLGLGLVFVVKGNKLFLDQTTKNAERLVVGLELPY